MKRYGVRARMRRHLALRRDTLRKRWNPSTNDICVIRVILIAHNKRIIHLLQKLYHTRVLRELVLVGSGNDAATV